MAEAGQAAVYQGGFYMDLHRMLGVQSGSEVPRPAPGRGGRRGGAGRGAAAARRARGGPPPAAGRPGARSEKLLA